MRPESRNASGASRSRLSVLTDRRWLLLAAAGMLIPFTTGNRAAAIAAWIAPILMVRFVHTTDVRRGLLVAGGVHAVAFGAAWYQPYPLPIPFLLALGLVFFAPYAVDRIVAPRIPGFVSTLVLPSAWVALEFALTVIPVINGTPIGTWGSLAYSQHGNLPLLQVASVTGLYGVTFLVAWTASVVNFVWERGLHVPAIRAGLAGFVALLAFVFALGGIRLISATEGETVRVAGVTVSNDQVFFRTWNTLFHGTELSKDETEVAASEMAELHDELFAKSQAAVREGAKVVAWAEDNAVVFPEDAPALLQRGQDFARDNGIALFMGMAVMEAGQPMDNQVVAITPTGQVHSTYLKAIPAPGELSTPGNGKIAWQDTQWGRFAAAICFDFDFPALIRQAGAADVDLMINAGDDWAEIDPMHPNMAILRSIENGFSQIRPTHEARSIAVDPYGRVVASREASEGDTRVLIADLPAAGLTTVYARIGDLFAYVAISLAFAFSAAAASTVVRTRVARKSQMTKRLSPDSAQDHSTEGSGSQEPDPSPFSGPSGPRMAEVRIR